MQAVILAAGRGNRMRPLTDSCHKTLLDINGAPLIDQLLEHIESVGIRRVTIATGYRAEEVEAHVRARFAHVDLRFVHIAEYLTTNNIVSLATTFDHLDLSDDLLLIEADLICDRSIIQRLLDAPAPDAALLDRWRSGLDGTVVTISEGVVTSVIPPHLQGVNFDFTDKYKTLNIYKFSAEFCRKVFAGLLRYYSRSVDGTVYYELILGILIYLRQAHIHAVLVEPGERWAEIDDPNDLSVARYTFEEKERRAILEDSFGGWWSHDVLDFAFLRNMYWPTAGMLSELRHDLPELLRNYGSRQSVLDRKLQWWLLCSEGRATAVAGLSQVFPWLRERLAGKRVLLPSPTFGEYPRAFPEHLSYRDDFAIDLAELERQISLAEVVVVVSPNNPTGTELDTEALAALIARHPDRLFLVDESFQGFSNQPSLIRSLECNALPNVLVLVSLSKMLGVPGARLGYVYTCHPGWRDDLRAGLPIWNLSSVAERLLEIGFKHRMALETSVQDTRRDRAAFAEALRGLAAVERVVEGGANFVVAAIRRGHVPAEGLVEYLLARHRIMAKDVSLRLHTAPDNGPVWLRLALRLPAENLRLIEALRELARNEIAAVTHYWRSQLKDDTYAGVENLMLLDPDGSTYSTEEVAGTLALLPALPAGAHVVELAAGAGRFTPSFARLAGYVIANDLVEEFIDMNRARCAAAGLTNIEFRTGNAAEFAWPSAGTVDLVFINWLLMYLPDREAAAVIEKSMTSLTDNGVLFLHESGDDGVPPEGEYTPLSEEYPARYRHAEWYRKILERHAGARGAFRISEFDLAPLYAKSSASGVQPALLLRLGVR